jgi:hypothetical protein
MITAWLGISTIFIKNIPAPTGHAVKPLTVILMIPGPNLTPDKQSGIGN